LKTKPIPGLMDLILIFWCSSIAFDTELEDEGGVP